MPVRSRYVQRAAVSECRASMVDEGFPERMQKVMAPGRVAVGRHCIAAAQERPCRPLSPGSILGQGGRLPDRARAGTSLGFWNHGCSRPRRPVSQDLTVFQKLVVPSSSHHTALAAVFNSVTAPKSPKKGAKVAEGLQRTGHFHGVESRRKQSEAGQGGG